MILYPLSYEETKLKILLHVLFNWTVLANSRINSYHLLQQKVKMSRSEYSHRWLRLISPFVFCIIISPLLRYVSYQPKPIQVCISPLTEQCILTYTGVSTKLHLVPHNLHYDASQLTLSCLPTYTVVPPSLHWGASQLIGVPTNLH